MDQKKYGAIHISKLKLTDKVFGDLKILENAKAKSTPVSSSKLLLRQSDSPEFENSFHYRSVIGKFY